MTVKLGSILFTLVEPHEGHEVEYNRWYERDHFYAGCLVGPGILAGKRWVATRPYKEMRIVPQGSVIAADAMTGSYLALYWVERSRQNEWGTWAAQEVHRLHEQGRMFPHRDHVHTRMYRYRWGAFRDADGVPPELALDHPFKGIGVVIADAREGVERDRVDAWYRDELLPDALSGSAAAMCLSFTPVPIPADAPADVPRSGDEQSRFVHIYFLDRDPADVWEGELSKQVLAVEEAGLARVQWAGPFIPTIPGTDTYTDRLW
jgi:hypothetical protein